MAEQAPSVIQGQHVIVTSTKSVGISLLLTLLFGPLGLLYATVKGALIVMFAVPAGFALVGTLLAGVSSAAHPGGPIVVLLTFIPLMFVTMWVLSIVWSITAVNAYNKALLARGA